jgi:hypothetical protein
MVAFASVRRRAMVRRMDDIGRMSKLEAGDAGAVLASAAHADGVCVTGVEVVSTRNVDRCRGGASSREDQSSEAASQEIRLHIYTLPR